ncbi:MAG: hypothetical protein ACLQOO_35905 [Terriglobia bacterium]
MRNNKKFLAKAQRRAESRRRTSLRALLPLRLCEKLFSSSSFCRPDLRGSSGVGESLRDQPSDSIMVVSRVSGEKEQRPAESKGLTGHVCDERRTAFSGPVERRKRATADLLILQWLLASLAERTDQGLLNLKNLLAVFPPRRKGSSENETVLRTSVSCKIVPNSAVFEPKHANNRRKWMASGEEEDRRARQGNRPHVFDTRLTEQSRECAENKGPRKKQTENKAKRQRVGKLEILGRARLVSEMQTVTWGLYGRI